MHLDGDESRIYRELTQYLGASDKAQNAIILMGALSKMDKNNKKVQKIKDGFLELVGVTFEDFNRFLDTL